ncbi:growth hormone receptor b [Aplochiton taeniatus]
MDFTIPGWEQRKDVMFREGLFTLWLGWECGHMGALWILQENEEKPRTKARTYSDLLHCCYLIIEIEEVVDHVSPPDRATLQSPGLDAYSPGTHTRPSNPDKEWKECPHYSFDGGDECYFDRTHTVIWTPYKIQLRSMDEALVYDILTFNVEDIVHPDPPVGLNWTLLKVSGLTGNHFDIMVNWTPAQSADVQIGWITLQYEVQYRQVNSALWSTLDLEKGTQRSVFGLQANVDHEVRVRCKMVSSPNFGAFSESIFIHIPSKEPIFPFAVLLIFAALFLVGILMLILVSKQQKLMVILLPPVPGPKIRGIDPELLKKDKLPELTSILGGPLDLRPELYSSDPWVEFIELDMEEPSERLSDLNTLMTCSPSSDCPPPSTCFRDDDSGRASCCDPDRVIISRDGLYTQVSEVRNSREVLLAPEEQRSANIISSNKIKEKDEKEKKELKVLSINAEVGGYTSELDPVRKSSSPAMEEPVPPPSPEWSFVPGLASGEYYSPASRPALLPAPSYTMVEAVDRQNSLLLKPAPHPVITKPIPTPEDYLTPDLLGSIIP